MFKKESETGTRRRREFKPKKDFVFKKKICKFCSEKLDALDYKNVPRIQKFMTERGKIIPARISGNCAKHQRQLARAVKKARAISLLPYVAE